MTGMTITGFDVNGGEGPRAQGIESCEASRNAGGLSFSMNCCAQDEMSPPPFTSCDTGSSV
jgi:hypothetical protein